MDEEGVVLRRRIHSETLITFWAQGAIRRVGLEGLVWGKGVEVAARSERRAGHVVHVIDIAPRVVEFPVMVNHSINYVTPISQPSISRPSAHTQSSSNSHPAHHKQITSSPRKKPRKEGGSAIDLPIRRSTGRSIHPSVTSHPKPRTAPIYGTTPFLSHPPLLAHPAIFFREEWRSTAHQSRAPTTNGTRQAG